MNANMFENDIPSDALDAMADLAYEQRQAMIEEWDEEQRQQDEQDYLSDIAVRLMNEDDD